MAAMTSSSMSGVFPPLGAAMPMMPGLAGMGSAVPSHSNLLHSLMVLY